jgi:hypothetical protein
MLTRFSTEEMQRLRNASGAWLPPHLDIRQEHS